MKLKNIAIEGRTTLLEENTYRFFEKKMKLDENIPPGFRCDWQNRIKLSIAKLINRISVSTKTEEYYKIFLFSDGNPNKDEFLEAHIYGAFDIKAIESVTGKSTIGNPLYDFIVIAIKEILNKNGQDWVEET